MTPRHTILSDKQEFQNTYIPSDDVLWNCQTPTFNWNLKSNAHSVHMPKHGLGSIDTTNYQFLAVTGYSKRLLS
jgi:hypothetical protein